MVKRRQNIFNTVFSLFINVLSFVIQFMLIYLLIDSYGTQFSGFVRINTTVFSFVGGTDGGIGIMTVLFLIKPLMNKDYEKSNEIIATSKNTYIKLFFVTLMIILVVMLGFIIFYYFILKQQIEIVSSSESSSSYYLSIIGMIVIIVSIGFKNLISFVWTGVYENLLQADQNNYINRLVVLIADLILYSILFLLINEKNNPIYVFLIFIFYSFAKSILLKIYVKIKYPWLNLKNNEFEPRLNLRTKYITIYKISNSILNHLDLVIAAVLLGFQTTAFLSLYLIVVSAFRNITNGFINSFKEYFAILSNKEGRIYWNDFQNFERYTLGVAGVVLILQYLFAPYLVNALFKNIISPSEFDDNLQLGLLYNNMFKGFVFTALTATQTFIYIITQPHNIMIYSKGYFNKVSIISLIISIFASILSFSIGLITLILTKHDYTKSIYAEYGVFLVFMIIQFFYLYYYSWSKLTYDSNFKNIFKNGIMTIIFFISAILLRKLWLENSIWKLFTSDVDNIYWEKWDNFIRLFLLTLIVSISIVITTMTILSPKWFWKLFLSLPFIKIFINWKNKKNVIDETNDDIFIQDIDGVYIKINTDQKRLDKNKKLNKDLIKEEVYILKG